MCEVVLWGCFKKKTKDQNKGLFIKKTEQNPYTYLYQQYPANASPAIPATLHPITIPKEKSCNIESDNDNHTSGKVFVIEPSIFHASIVQEVFNHTWLL